MTPAQLETEIHFADEDDTQAAIADAVEYAGVTLDDLRRQAEQSRFGSERARMAWFMISSLVEQR